MHTSLRVLAASALSVGLLAVSPVPGDPPAPGVPPFVTNGPGFSRPFFPVGARAGQIQAADLNGDPIPDFLVVNGARPGQNPSTPGPGDLSLYKGTGGGQFLQEQRFPTGGTPKVVTVADVTSDGHPDLLVVNIQSTQLRVFPADGQGGFGTAIVTQLPGAATAMTVLDLDHAAGIDLAVASALPAQATLLLGNGNGTFSLAGALPVGSNPLDVAAADLN